MAPDVSCYACGRTYAFPRKRCACGEPLWFDTDPSAADRSNGGRGMWTYVDLLPVGEPRGIGVAAGGTPLIRVDRPGLDVGCRLYVKDETEHPTGAFKDRGSAVGAAWVADHGPEWIGTVSHGNMAMSTAAHAAAADLGCVVLVPADIPAERLAHIAQFDPTIVRVEGSYGQLYYDTLAFGPDLGVEFVNSDTPLRGAGHKTVAFEICDAFAPDVPDAIVLPTSSGGHASAIWKGLREFRSVGVIDTLPRLYLVQASACDPIATAYRDDARVVDATTAGETIAYSIANPDPPSGNRALAAVRETGGAVLSVTDDDIRAAKTTLSTEVGLSVEPASATALAGIRRLVDSETITADDTVVMIATGTGFKGRPDVHIDAEAVQLDTLEDRLATVLT